MCLMSALYTPVVEYKNEKYRVMSDNEDGSMHLLRVDIPMDIMCLYVWDIIHVSKSEVSYV